MMLLQTENIGCEKARGLNDIARFIAPTIGNLTSLLVLYLLITNAKLFLSDGDTGFHIRIGDLIRQSGTVPRTDPFSYTMLGHEWYAWEWMTDLFMSCIHNALGLTGIVGVAILILWFVFTALYYWMVSRGANPLLALGLTIFTASTSSFHWLARPHLVSIGMFLVVGAILESYARKRSRSIYAIPFIIALWVNMHGAFIAVFPMFAIYAAGEVPKLLRQKFGNSEESVLALKTYLAIGLMSLGASLLSPYGWHIHGHIWRYMTDSALLSSVQEFHSPDFRSNLGALIEIFLFLGIVAAYRAATHGRWVHVGLIVMWFHLVLQSARHVPPALIIVVPIIAEHWSALLTKLRSELIVRRDRVSRLGLVIGDLIREMVKTDKQLSGILPYFGGIIFFGFILFGPWTERLLHPQFDPQKQPVHAVNHFDAQGLSGNIFASDENGDYLIYRLYPKVKVFVDGRNDFYSTGGVWWDYVKIVELNPSWQELLDKYRVQWLMLPNKSALSMVAHMGGDWECTYEDAHFVILGRKDGTANN